MITSRPATISDVRKFYPNETCSFRAWVAELDGEVAGIIGIALMRDGPSIFCSFVEDLRPHLKCMTILRLVKKLDVEMSRRRGPIFAIRQDDEPKAEAILRRLGFHFHSLLDGERIFWRG